MAAGRKAHTEPRRPDPGRHMTDGRNCASADGRPGGGIFLEQETKSRPWHGLLGGAAALGLLIFLGGAALCVLWCKGAAALVRRIARGGRREEAAA